MRLILVYDINTEDKEGKRRLIKALKVARRYLFHVQKSVFEGELTEGQVEMLKADILDVVDKDKDSVIVYTFPDGVKWGRFFWTNLEEDPTSRFL